MLTFNANHKRVHNRHFPLMRGYTLLELLVVIGIVGFLAMMTIPSFQDTIRRNAREGAMLELTTAIALARTEAVTQALDVSICRSTDSATCAAGGGGANWDAGWIIFSDAATAGTVDVDDTLLQVQGSGNGVTTITLQTRLNADFAGDFLRFDEDGFLNNTTSGAYFKFCDLDNDLANARALWLSNTGRPAMSTGGGDDVHNDLAGDDLEGP